MGMKRRLAVSDCCYLVWLPGFQESVDVFEIGSLYRAGDAKTDLE